MSTLTRLIALVLFSFSLTVSADDHTYNQISLQTSASKDVANDVLVAVLVVQENGHQAATLADRVNKKMADVLAKAERVKAVESHTTSYNSQPLYKNGKINSWQVSQQIKLTSQDFEQLGKLIADVNELARVQSMTFKVSDQRIEATKEELTKTAIAKFKTKAQLITEQFGKSDYQLVHVSIGGNQSMPQPVRMERMMMADSAKAAPPATSAGTNKITVNINGTIELGDE